MSNVLNLVSEETFVDQTDDIVEAINAIGGDTNEFKLLPSGTITVTNRAFSVPYVGTAPDVSTAKILIVNRPFGVTDGLSFTASFANGIATFASTKSKKLTVAVDCVVIVGGYSFKMTIQGLPIDYEPVLKEAVDDTPILLTQSGDDLVGSVHSYPENVSPVADVSYYGDGVLFDASTQIYVEEFSISQGVLTIYNINASQISPVTGMTLSPGSSGVTLQVYVN